MTHTNTNSNGVYIREANIDDRFTLSEVDYILGAIQVLEREVSTAHSSEPQERLLRMYTLLARAVADERQGKVTMIGVPDGY